MSAIAKAIARTLFDDYQFYWIVAQDMAALPPAEALPPALRFSTVDPAIRTTMAASITGKVRSAARYGERGATGYALLRDDMPLSILHIADPRSGWDERIWPMAADEAGVLDIVTEESARGQGLAARLLERVAPICRERGVTRLLAHIWWTHDASLRSFRKAGWKRIGLSIRIRCGRREIARHIRLRA